MEHRAGSASGGVSRLFAYRRILVLGSPGSGKSVLSTKLAARIGAPLVRLDDLYWDQNWVRRAQPDFEQAQQDAVDEASWVIDGNHASTLHIRLARAEAALFLDVSPVVCLYRIARRGLARYLGQRESLPQRIREDAGFRPSLSVDPRFVRKVARFRSDTRRTMFRQIRASATELVVARTHSDVEQLLRA